VTDEANDAAEDDDPLEDGEDLLYLTIPTCHSSTGTSVAAFFSRFFIASGVK
jgi:hypothetical protein